MRVGSLFTGYGGLDMATGGDMAWYAEIEPAACTVLAAHHPGVPNLGDVTAVDWSTVPAVDVLTGGYPCQPFSLAGNRKGTDDPRHLWPTVARAVDALRPRYVVLENVRAHLTLGFGSVLSDLSRMGYDARWGVVRASDAGAPHGRARLFVVAHPSGYGHVRVDDTRSTGGVGGQGLRTSLAGRGIPATNAADLRHERNGFARDGRTRPENDDINAVPYPQGDQGGIVDRNGLSVGSGDESSVDWGKYAPAIRRWECVTGRRSPAPTVPGLNGRPRLSARFAEWMMGLPDGHVTGHGLSASQALKMCGNGVVPQQARLALSLLGWPA